MSLQFLFSIRNCKTVMIVCSDPTVVDRLCVKSRLGVLVSSTVYVAGVGAETHLCVRTFLT